MWFLVAVAGLAAASMPFDAAEDETDLALSDSEGPAGAEADDDTSAAADPSAMDDAPEGDTAEAAADTDDAEPAAPKADDPWLAGDPLADEFVSTDLAPPDDTPEPVAPPPPPPNEETAARDPWLDGWVDDEFLSTDDPSVIA